MPLPIVDALRDLEEMFFERAVHFEVDGDRFHIASAEDMVVMKIISGRARDLEDAESIVAARG